MSLRIGVPVLAHETNTFADSSTGRTEYDRFDVWRGDGVLEFWENTQTPPGGIIEGIREIGAEVVPIYSAFAQPSGTITKDAYVRLLDELLKDLKASLPLDALALTLHGAGVAEGVDEIEADISRRIRAIVGPDVPLVGVFDLHGNVTPDVAEPLDAFFGYHLYPHEDMHERGKECVEFISALLDKRVHPVSHIEYIPVLLPTSTTDFGPAAEANRVCAEIEARPGVVDCTFFHGFPYADVPLVGAHAVAIADGDADVARTAARDLAQWIWDHREEFRTTYPPADEAVARALAIDGRPVVINEGSDNCGGGAPGDGTHLLRALLESGAKESCFGYIYDPGVAAQAHSAGEGATIDVELGGKHDDLHGKPIQATARVKRLSDGRFRLRSFAGGMLQELGKMANLEIDGVDVLVGSERSQVFDPEIFLLHDIDVGKCKIVALKSSQHFRAGFRDVAVEIISADTPGITTNRVEIFDHRRNRYPVWPSDKKARYPVSS